MSTLTTPTDAAPVPTTRDPTAGVRRHIGPARGRSPRP